MKGGLRSRQFSLYSYSYLFFVFLVQGLRFLSGLFVFFPNEDEARTLGVLFRKYNYRARVKVTQGLLRSLLGELLLPLKEQKEEEEKKKFRIQKSRKKKIEDLEEQKKKKEKVQVSVVQGFGIGVGYFAFCRSLSSHVFKIEDEMKYLAFTLFSFLLLFFNLCSYS